MIPPESMVKPRARGVRSQPGALMPFAIPGGGGYAGASSVKRALREWHPLERSADYDAVPDLPMLRSRSLDLSRNSPIAGGAVSTVVTSVVGSGLELQAAIDRDFLGISDDDAKVWERNAELIWRHWTSRCDIRRRQDFGQIQDTALRSELVGGDMLVVRRNRKDPGDLLGLKLQMIEAGRVSTPPDKAADPRIIDGVEQDDDGAPIAYWVRNRHRYDWNAEVEKWSRVTVMGAGTRRRQVLHLAELERPGQTRGVPYLAPVIEILKNLERYTESELAAAVVSSFFTVAVTTENAEGLANQAGDPNAVDDGTINSRSNDLKLGPAAILDLAPGEGITPIDPMRPNSGFDPFVMAMMTQIGMRLEIPVEVLTKHFKASYSAARGALAEAWRFFSKRRSYLARDLCDPVYEWVISEAVLSGNLVTPGFDRDPITRQAWLGATWIGSAKGHVDPVKEVTAVGLLRDRNWISDGEATQELRGVAFEDVAMRRKRDVLVLRENGLSEAAPAVPSNGGKPPMQDDDGDEKNPDLPDTEDET